MTLALRQQEQAARDAVEKHAPGAQLMGRGRWQFELTNGRPIPVTTKLDDRWLVIEARPEIEASPLSLWRLALINSDLPGGGRLALSTGSRCVHLGAEIPLDHGIDVTGRLGEALRDISHACATLEEKEAKNGSDPPKRTAATHDSEPAWPRLLGEAGWACTERSSGKLVIDLDVPPGFYQAAFVERPDGSVRITAELAAAPAFSPVSRRALGLLMLTASDLLRLARGAAEGTNGREVASFDVAFASTPSPTELDHALSACSQACRCFGREVKALTDEGIAQTYLDLRGWNPEDQKQPASRTRRQRETRQARSDRGIEPKEPQATGIPHGE